MRHTFYDLETERVSNLSFNLSVGDDQFYPPTNLQIPVVTDEGLFVFVHSKSFSFELGIVLYAYDLRRGVFVWDATEYPFNYWQMALDREYNIIYLIQDTRELVLYNATNGVKLHNET